MKTAVIWSKDNCPYCDQAKELLASIGYIIEERKIGEVFTKDALLESVPNARSVPQIFLGDEYVGGLIALRSYIESANKELI